MHEAMMVRKMEAKVAKIRRLVAKRKKLDLAIAKLVGDNGKPVRRFSAAARAKMRAAAKARWAKVKGKT